MKKALINAAFGLLCILSASRLAFAHALLVASSPAVNAIVHGPGVDVDFKFNSRVDGMRSRLILVLPDGSSQPLSLLKQPAPEALAAHAQLKPGSYMLRWQAVAADGHISRGEVPFKVQ